MIDKFVKYREKYLSEINKNIIKEKIKRNDFLFFFKDNVVLDRAKVIN